MSTAEPTTGLYLCPEMAGTLMSPEEFDAVEDCDELWKCELVHGVLVATPLPRGLVDLLAGLPEIVSADFAEVGQTDEWRKGRLEEQWRGVRPRGPEDAPVCRDCPESASQAGISDSSRSSERRRLIPRTSLSRFSDRHAQRHSV